MVAVLPDIHPTGRYSIGEAAALLGVNRHTITRWVKDGQLVASMRKANGRRFVTGKELIRIYHNSY